MSGKITRKSSFTAVPNSALHNKNLSWKAKGLLCYLLSMSEEWNIYKKDLKNRSTDGYDGMLSGFKELEDAGYIETITLKDAGLFGSVDYIVHDYPVRENPDLIVQENPVRENPDLINNSLKERKELRCKEFKKKLKPFLKTENNPKGYDPEFLKAFFEYWTETSEERKTVRFESEGYFDIKRRLTTFRLNKEKPHKQEQSKKYYLQTYTGQEVGN